MATFEFDIENFDDGTISAQAFSQWLNETMTVGDSRWYYGSIWRPEALTLSDSQFKAIKPTKTETIAIADTKWFAGSYWRTENLTTTDKRAMGMVLAPKSETITISDDVEALLVQLFEKLLSESITIADALAGKGITVVRTDNVALVDTRRFDGSYVKGDTLAISDTTTKTPSLIKSDSFSLSDSQYKAMSAWKAESLALAESIRKGETHTLADTIILADNTLKSLTKNISDNLTVGDNVAKLAAIIKSDSITLSDSYTSQIIKILELAETLQILDSMATQTQIQKILTENIQIADAYRRIVNLGNLLVGMFAKIIVDDISDKFSANFASGPESWR